MLIKEMFIENKKDFEEISNIVQKLYKLSKSLPGNVFSDQFTQFKMNEFDWLTFDEFWVFIKDITTISGDSSIIVSVLDPDPIHYHFKHFNYYNTVKIPTYLSVDEYRKVLEYHLPDSEADAIKYNSRLLAIFPPSQKWAIWADRSHELMIFGLNTGAVLRHTENLFEEWTSIKDINQIKDLVYFALATEKEVDEFASQLQTNYK